MSARPQQTECTYISVNYTMLGDYSSSNNPEFFLSIPSTLTSLDPAWRSCTPALYGAWDPPTTLEAATALTDAAPKATLPPVAARASHVTSLCCPTTSTAVTDSHVNISPSATSVPNVPQTSGSPEIPAVELADLAITQHFKGAAPLTTHSDALATILSSLEGQPHSINSSKRPTVSSPAPTDVKALEQALSGDADMIPVTSGPGIEAQNTVMALSDSDSAISMSSSAYVFLSLSNPDIPPISSKPTSRINLDAPLSLGYSDVFGSLATMSGQTIYSDYSDVISDSDRCILPKPMTESKAPFPNGLSGDSLNSSHSRPAEPEIHGQITSIIGSGVTFSGTAPSAEQSAMRIGSSVLSITTTPSSLDPKLGSSNTPEFRNESSPTANRNSNSNAKVLTSGKPMSSCLHSIIGMTFITSIILVVTLLL